jgi:Ca-activated chloride channel family protein
MKIKGGILMRAGFTDKNGEYLNIPLKGITVSGKVWGTFSEITVKQEFENKSVRNIEAIYIFPLPDSAAITNFEARIGEKKINSFILEKDEAFKIYDDAIHTGDSSFLLGQFRPNIFQVSVGQILPGETVEIEIEYIEDLKYDDLQLRITIPTVVAPRYIPGKPVGEKTGPGISNPTDRVPDADYITPPLGVVDYKIDVDLVVDLLRPIKSISSPSHNIRLQDLANDAYRVRLAEGPEVPDRDFILVCTCEEEESSRGFAYQNEGNEGVMYLTFVPEIPPVTDESIYNYIFLIDVSGSMSGEKLEQAKNALNICIRNLSDNDTFNIIAFESRTHYFSETGSLPFTQISLDRASSWIDNLKATGGTEILDAIKHSLRPDRTDDSIILIFTDGQVGNEDEVINYVAKNIGKSRIFPFGIDTAVNSYFIRRLAEIGKGKAEFVYPGERIDDKVIRQFARIASPLVENIKLEWKGIKVKEVFPESIEQIYDMEPITILAKFSDLADGEVIIRGNAGKHDILLNLSASQIIKGKSYCLLEKVWARKKIGSLEDALAYTSVRRENRIREEIVKLSKKYNVVSSLTSFVAVHVRTNKVTGLPMTKTVPVSMPRGWELGPHTAGVSISERLMPSYGPLTPVHESSQTYIEKDIPCFVKNTENAYKAKSFDYMNILRMLARNQQANGAFSNKNEKDMLKKIETTAMVLIAFTAGGKSISMYKKQIGKSVKYLIERIVNGKVKPDRGKNSHVLMKTVLAFELCLLRGVVKGDTAVLINEMVKDIREASLSSASISGQVDMISIYMDKNPDWRDYRVIEEIAGIVENEDDLEDRISSQNDESNSILDIAKLGILKASTTAQIAIR